MRYTFARVIDRIPIVHVLHCRQLILFGHALLGHRRIVDAFLLLIVVFLCVVLISHTQNIDNLLNQIQNRLLCRELDFKVDLKRLNLAQCLFVTDDRFASKLFIAHRDAALFPHLKIIFVTGKQNL